MSKNKIAARIDSQSVEVKTKFDAEFRRFSLNKSEKLKYEQFKALIEKLHRIHDIPILISYTDPGDGDLLPINNDDNFARALLTAKPMLRVIIQRKGDSLEELNGYGTIRPRNIISDGTSVRVTPNGVERSPGIFISRLVPGGLAESTGLLGVNDEVLEVNGIDVSNKTLDQVSTGEPFIPQTARFDQDEQDEIVDLTAVTLQEQPEQTFQQVASKDDGQILHL
ncbi:unnamed protein product [Leptidea sinapis]|uniref:PB1 domain-containing protein n=1 Tax=Leptidea sinapis TaxID=189913 RepID=A0A5E4QQR8_9NEOP|nr:unnamed protein product [Leptidea sinapis]